MLSTVILLAGSMEIGEAVKAGNDIRYFMQKPEARGSSTDWVIAASAPSGRHTTKLRSAVSGSSSATSTSVPVAIVDNVEKASPADWSFDFTTGEIVFAPGSVPDVGEAVTAGYEFDVPVRFDTERIAVSLTAFKAGQIPSIPLIEVQL